MASSHHSSSEFGSALECGTNILNAKMLEPLDEVLRCRICCDYFSNCMSTKCSHNYCSLCIRRYMSYKSQCPTCFQLATEPELQNNRLIDEILQIYLKIREKLNIPPESIDVPIPKQVHPSKSTVTQSVPEVEKAGTSTDDIFIRQNEDSSDKVACPVCNGTVLKTRINIHLDICLRKSEKRSQDKSLPKLVYHLMSDKDIKMKLKDHGLSTSGDRQTLVRRHRNFVTLFNANKDSLKPKPVEYLLLEIEQQELEERLNATPRNKLIYKRTGLNPSEFEIDHTSYLQKHRSQFNALIQDVQERALERNIKQEIDNSEVTTSNITDESGNVIGESIFSVRTDPHLEPVTVKKEVSDSPLEGVNLRRSLLSSSEESLSSLSDSDPVIIKEEPPESLDEEHNQDQDLSIQSAIYDKEPDTGCNKSSQLPFRVKKGLPVMKIKEEPQFLLDPVSNEEYKADRPSSKDGFETSKKQSNKSLKKKNAKRHSAEEKNSQRKK